MVLKLEVVTSRCYSESSSLHEGFYSVDIELKCNRISKGVVLISVENKQSLGKSGEAYAARLVTESGLRIITQNYRCPKGEMDIIARDGEVLVFIEVRTRRSSYRGWGEESITRQKVQRLHAIASFYILQQGYINWPSVRFDVFAIRWIGQDPEINWIQAAL